MWIAPKEVLVVLEKKITQSNTLFRWHFGRFWSFSTWQQGCKGFFFANIGLLFAMVLLHMTQMDPFGPEVLFTSQHKGFFLLDRRIRKSHLAFSRIFHKRSREKHKFLKGETDSLQIPKDRKIKYSKFFKKKTNFCVFLHGNQNTMVPYWLKQEQPRNKDMLLNSLYVATFRLIRNAQKKFFVAFLAATNTDRYHTYG